MLESKKSCACEAWRGGMMEMRKVCVFLGLAAIGYKLSVGAIFALFLGTTVSQIISVAVAAAIAAAFVVRGRLDERLGGPPWVAVGFGVAGGLVFLLKFLPASPFLPLLLFVKFRLVGGVLASVADGLLLLLFLKLAADLLPSPQKA